MITSTSNHKVKELLQLQKKAKARNQAGVFIAEGSRMVLETPKNRIKQLYISESYFSKGGQELDENGYDFEILSDTVFAYVSDTKTPQGILAIVNRKEYSLEDILSKEDAHLMVLDNLQDPGNLGTIFRTAEAAGVTGIVLSKDCVDIYNPKVIRSTMGAIYRMPFVYVEDILKALDIMKKRGITTYAAHLKGENSYDKEDYKKACAFLIGNEGNGLREEVSDKADVWIKIPMLGQAESLNAAVAASVLMFEAARQRRD